MSAERTRTDLLSDENHPGRDLAVTDRRTFLRTAAALGCSPAIASLIAACGSTASVPATTGVGTLSSLVPGFRWKGGVRGGAAAIGFTDTNPVFEPATGYGLVYYALPSVFRGLVIRGGDLAHPTLEPDIAESFDVNKSGTRYNFKVRQGVGYHTGGEVVAADFKYVIERTVRYPGGWAGGYLTSVTGYNDFLSKKTPHLAGVTVPSKYELNIQLDKPDAIIAEALQLPPYGAYPEAEVKRLGNRWALTPVGAGPYKIDSYDNTQSVASMSRFDNYIWGKYLPYFDSQEWRWNLSADVQYLQIRRGDLDGMLGSVPLAAIANVQHTPAHAQLGSYPSYGLSYLPLNVRSGPTADKRVRQALNYAVNPGLFKSQDLTITRHIYPPTLLGYDPTLPTYSYDPERAKSLLASAGYKAGALSLTIPVLGDENPPGGTVEQSLQQSFEAVGINVKLQTNAATYTDIPKKLTQWPMFLMVWGMGLPDPAEIYLELFGPTASQNFYGYNNSTVNAYAVEGQSRTDRSARAELYREYEKGLIDDAAAIFLGVIPQHTFQAPNIANFFYEPVFIEWWDRYWKA